MPMVFARLDGSIAVVVFPPDQPQPEPEACIGRCVPAGSVHLPDAVLPSRRFRDCWRHRNGRVEAEAALARAQILTEVRAERNQRLAESDGEHLALTEMGTSDQRRQLQAYRQALRDLPALVETQLAGLTDQQLGQFQPTWPPYARQAETQKEDRK